jgi:hypothetical protein
MAIRHGLAGQFGKAQSLLRYRRIIGLFLAIGCVGFTLLGFAWGFFFLRYGSLIGAVAILAVTAAVWYAIRRAEKYVEKLAKERVKYMRGGQCEALIAWLLEDLEDEWHIFNNVKLERDSDIDHLVIGPGGMFCISTKSHRGVFSGTSDGLLHNGQPSRFAQQVMRQTMDIKDRLAVAMGKDVPWVQTVLAVPFGYTERDACGGKVWLVHQENILDRLAPEGAPRKLTEQQITRVVKVLEMIQQGAAEIYQRPEPTNSSANLSSPAPRD